MSTLDEELIQKYLRIRTEHDKIETRVKTARLAKTQLRIAFQETEDHLKAIQSAGMFVGEILNQQTP